MEVVKHAQDHFLRGGREENESKAGLVPHGFVVGKKRKEGKETGDGVKMSGWNDSKLSILYVCDRRYD